MSRALVWIQSVAVPALGPWGIFLVAFLDSSLLSLPEINDLLVVGSAAADPASAWVFVTMATLGSLLGCSVLWVLGRRGDEALLLKRFGVRRVDWARDLMERWGVFAIAIPALLPPPAPFKVFVLAAGVFGVSYRRFAITLIVSRGLRYIAWAALGVVYGEAARNMLRAVDTWAASRLIELALAGAAVALAAGLWVRLRRREPLEVGEPGLDAAEPMEAAD